MSSFFKFLGVFVILSGIVLGCVSAQAETGVYYKYTEFVWEIAFIYWFASLISGMLFIAVGAVLDYLFNISKYCKKISNYIDDSSDSYKKEISAIINNTAIIAENTEHKKAPVKSIQKEQK